MTWWKEYFTLVGTGLGTRAYKEYEFLDDVDLFKEGDNVRFIKQRIVLCCYLLCFIN